MADFNPDTCVCGQLDSDLSTTDTSIENLDLNLAVDEYTFLTLSNGINCEHVKVTQTANGLAIVRGQGTTNAYAWPKGTHYAFQWSKVAFEAMVDCILNNDDVPDDAPKIEGYEAQIIDGQLCYTPIEDESDEAFDTVTIQGKECIYTFAAKNVSKDPIPTSQRLMPGVYENATVTVDSNGCITNVKGGCKVTIQGCVKCGNCNCNCEPESGSQGSSG